MCLYYTLVCVQIHTYIPTHKTMHWCLCMQANIYLSGVFLLYRSVFFIVRKCFLYWGHGKSPKDDWQDSTQVVSLCAHCVTALQPPLSQEHKQKLLLPTCARFEVLKAVLLKISVFWSVALCNLGEWFLFQKHQALQNVINCYPNDKVSLYRDWIYRSCLYVNRMAMW